MRVLLITIVALLVACNNTITDQGFTNKAEAKNEMVNGVKEGKWVEYFALINGLDTLTLDTNQASYFNLTIYKKGRPFGIQRKYYKEGVLMKVTPYTGGEKNGNEIKYYEDGKLRCLYPYSMGKLNGMVRGFYENGKIGLETPYSNGIENGIEKEYYESGNLLSETTCARGVKGVTKTYDENGNEIK